MLYGPNRAVVVLSLQSSRINLQLGVTEPNAKMFSFSLGSILLCFAQLPPLVQPRLTIAEKHAGSETPLPLVRAMTPEEVAAKAAKSRKEVAWPSVRCGLGAAMDLREKQLEAEGQETAASKKRRRKEEAGNDRSQALKMVNGAHLLK